MTYGPDKLFSVECTKYIECNPQSLLTEVMDRGASGEPS